MEEYKDMDMETLCEEELLNSQKAINGLQQTMDTYFLLKKDDTGKFMRKEIEKYKLHYFYYLNLKKFRLSEEYIDVDPDSLKLLLLTVQKLIKIQNELLDMFDDRMFKRDAELKLENLKKDVENYKNQYSFLERLKFVIENKE